MKNYCCKQTIRLICHPISILFIYYNTKKVYSIIKGELDHTSCGILNFNGHACGILRLSACGISNGRTLRNVQNKHSGSNHWVNSCASFSQNNVCKSASGSRSKKLTGTIRSSLANGFKTDMNSSSSSEAEILQASKGVFSGGLRRAEVQLPGLVLRVRVEEKLEWLNSPPLFVKKVWTLTFLQ